MIGDMLSKGEHDIILLQEVGGRDFTELLDCKITVLMKFFRSCTF